MKRIEPIKVVAKSPIHTRFTHRYTTTATEGRPPSTVMYTYWVYCTVHGYFSFSSIEWYNPSAQLCPFCEIPTR